MTIRKPLRLSTPDPLFDPAQPVSVNGFLYAPATAPQEQTDGLYLSTALMVAQRKIDALEKHADAMAEALEQCDCDTHHAASLALADYTAWMIDGVTCVEITDGE